MNLVNQVENINLEKDNLDKIKNNIEAIDKEFNEKYKDILDKESEENLDPEK